MRSALLDDDVVAFLAAQGHRTAIEFGKKLEHGEPPLLEWGERPEYRPITADGRPRIFVAKGGADWWRIRYQIAHEVFHWICTPPGTFHWTHELLAVEVAVRAMDALGEADYARRAMDDMEVEAEQLPLHAMLTTPLDHHYPPGLHGRALMTGRQLIAAVGWEQLKRLAHGQPDVHAWFRALQPAEQAAAEAVLGPPSSGWV